MQTDIPLSFFETIRDASLIIQIHWPGEKSNLLVFSGLM
jgi:hypothetical protein